jgi:uncharacterized protein (DUF1697 family)
VGGNKSVPMLELKKLATGLGYAAATTYIQSGNLVFVTDEAPREAEAALEQAIEKRFKFPVPIIVRTVSEWKKYAAGSPFPDAERERPNLLLLGVAKQPVKRGAFEALLPYAQGGERISVLKDALWIDFGNGVAKSKLTPAVLDRIVGSTVTARNVRTVQKLAELLTAAR